MKAVIINLDKVIYFFSQKVDIFLFLHENM